MNRNMKQWAADLMAAAVKKPLPLLSFPCVQLMDVTVRELVSDSALQARQQRAIKRALHRGRFFQIRRLQNV